MYFDLYEIERRYMEEALSSRAHTADETRKVYDKSLEDLNKLIKKFTEEVELGENMEAMTEWNNYIREQLGINNLKAFNLAFN